MRRSSGGMMRNGSHRTMRALRLAALVFGIGLVVTASAARAEDDEDDSTFEQKAIKQIMTGLGGTNMENTGIDYRERSPLVVPPRIDLPPPDTAASTVNVPNWPKDPDVQQRRAAAAAAQRTRPEEALES